MFEILNDFISFPILVCTSSYKDLDQSPKSHRTNCFTCSKPFLFTSQAETLTISLEIWQQLRLKTNLFSILSLWGWDLSHYPATRSQQKNAGTFALALVNLAAAIQAVCKGIRKHVPGPQENNDRCLERHSQRLGRGLRQ